MILESKLPPVGLTDCSVGERVFEGLELRADAIVIMFPPVRPGDTTVTILPFFQMFGLTVLVSHTLAHQGCVVTIPASIWSHLCNSFRITAFGNFTWCRRSLSRWQSILWSTTTTCPESK